jgi:hypothetical protein
MPEKMSSSERAGRGAQHPPSEMMQSSALMVRRPQRVAAVELSPSPFGLVASRIGSVSRGPRSEACTPLPSAPASAWAITDVQMRFGSP